MQGGPSARCVFDSVVLGGAFLFLGDTTVRHDSRSSGPVPLSRRSRGKEPDLNRISPRNLSRERPVAETSGDRDAEEDFPARQLRSEVQRDGAEGDEAKHRAHRVTPS